MLSNIEVRTIRSDDHTRKVACPQCRARLFDLNTDNWDYKLQGNHTAHGGQNFHRHCAEVSKMQGTGGHIVGASQSADYVQNSNGYLAHYFYSADTVRCDYS